MGYSVPSVKLASILPLILTLIFVRIKSKKLFGKNANRISFLFLFLAGLCPAVFQLSVELRMYTWAMFFVTCTGIYAYELYQSPENTKTLFSLSLFGVLSAYTHYYAFLTVCFVYLFLIIALLKTDLKNWKTCLAFSLFSILGYLPWIPIIFVQFSAQVNSWWLTTFTAENIFEIITYLFDSNFTGIFLAFFIAIMIRLLFYLKKEKQDTEGYFALFAILAFIATIMTGIIFSLLVRPVFVSRYLYPASGLLFLGICIAICKVEYKNIFTFITVGIFLINLPFSYWKLYQQEYKTGTEKFKELVRTTIKNEPITTTIQHLSWSVLPYYCSNNEITFRVASDIRGYLISAATFENLQILLPDATLTPIFSGDIDNTYSFIVYYVE